MNNKGIVFLGIGFELVAMCVGGYLLGDFIDKKMGWQGFASSYLVLILLIGWFFHLIILLKRFEKDHDDIDSPKP